MWREVIDMVVALAAFIGFPFLMIAIVAGLIVLFDHLVHFTNRNQRGPRAA